MTVYAGIPLFVRALRSFDVPGSGKRHRHVKQRGRGFDEATYVESLLGLKAPGGESLEDVDRLGEDAGLAAMVGHAMPSPKAARRLLYQFHEESRVEQAQQKWAVGQVSYIPEESARLRGLAQVHQDVVRAVAQRCADQRIATICKLVVLSSCAIEFRLVVR